MSGENADRPFGFDLDEYTALVEGMAEAMEEAAPAVASAQRELFEELVDQGFTEQQAIELVNEFEVNYGD